MAALKDGYKKQIAGQGAGSDDYVLLAGGGHKALSEIISGATGLDNNSLQGFLYQDSANQTKSIGSIVTSDGQVAIPYTYYDNAVAKYAGTTDLFYKSGSTFYIGTGVKSTYFVGVANNHVPTGTAGGSATGGEGSSSGSTGGSTVVQDILTSTSTTAALSANQGRVLNTTTVHLTGNETITGVKTFNGGGTDGANPSILAKYGVTTGGTSVTGYSGMQSIRKCSSDSNYINTAGFIVNSDGSAKFVHRRGSTSAVSNNDDSYITFDARGGWIAYSGTKGSAVNDSQKYQIIDSHNISNYVQSSVGAAYVTFQESSLSIGVTSANYDRDTVISCGTLSSITISTIEALANEVLVTFSTGASVTNFLSIPLGTKYAGQINIEPNKSYAMSILAGILVLGEVMT